MPHFPAGAGRRDNAWAAAVTLRQRQPPQGLVIQPTLGELFEKEELCLVPFVA